MLLENRYAPPQLLPIMTSELNIRYVVIFRENRIGFESESIKIENKVEK